jgi:hypothetical protein
MINLPISLWRTPYQNAGLRLASVQHNCAFRVQQRTAKSCLKIASPKECFCKTKEDMQVGSAQEHQNVDFLRCTWCCFSTRSATLNDDQLAARPRTAASRTTDSSSVLMESHVRARRRSARGGSGRSKARFAQVTQQTANLPRETREKRGSRGWPALTNQGCWMR